MKRNALPLLLVLLLASMAGTQDGIPVERMSVGSGELKIVGPSEADLGNEVTLTVIGLPPVEDATTVGDLRALARELKGLLDVNVPPEAADGDWWIKASLDFDLEDEQAPGRFVLRLWAKTAGDYVVVLVVPSNTDDDAGWDTIRMAHHRVRYGHVVPPKPDPVISVTPDESFAAEGPVGGPFDPPEQVYGITNSGTGTLHWQVAVSVPWLQAVPSTGVLAEGQSVECHVGFSDAAKSLTAGVYVGRIDFENLVNGKGDTFQFASVVVKGDTPVTEKLYLILIYQEQDEHTYPRYVSQLIRTEEWEQLRSDPPEDDDKFREWIFDPQSATASLKTWVQMAATEGWDLPVFILADQDGNVLNHEMPASFEAGVKLVKDHLPE